MIWGRDEGRTCPFNIRNTFTAGGRLVHNTRSLLLLYLFYQQICPIFLLQLNTNSWVRKSPAGLFYPRGVPGFHIISLQAPFDYNCFVISCKISALILYCSSYELSLDLTNCTVCLLLLGFLFFNYQISTAFLGGLHLGYIHISYCGKKVHWVIWDHRVRRGQISSEQYWSGNHLVNGLFPLHSLSLLLFPARWCVRFISELLDRDEAFELLWGCISSPTLLNKDFRSLCCKFWSGSFSEFSLLHAHRAFF